MERFTQFLETAQAADLKDKQAFALMVREGIALLGMSVRDAGVLFKTAPGTVSRWENGHTAPALVARDAVRNLLTTRINRIAAAVARPAPSIPRIAERSRPERVAAHA